VGGEENDFGQGSPEGTAQRNNIGSGEKKKGLKNLGKPPPYGVLLRTFTIKGGDIYRKKKGEKIGEDQSGQRGGPLKEGSTHWSFFNNFYLGEN